MSVELEPDFSNDDVFISRFPVHRACRDGDIGALVSLLQQLSNQAHLTAEDSCYGWTPLHWAAHYGQVGIKICPSLCIQCVTVPYSYQLPYAVLNSGLTTLV